MDELFDLGAEIGALLMKREETIAVGESSSGGLISAALLSMPGASRYFLGGAVVYAPAAFRALTRIDRQAMKTAQIRSATQPYASLLAQDLRQSHRADWGLSETGAAGPDGNPYGDAAGHSCFAVSGRVSAERTLETGLGDRRQNMVLFARAGLDFMRDILTAAGP